MRILLAIFLTAAMPAMAQDDTRPVTIDLTRLIELASEPWRNGTAFEAALSDLLPGLTVTDATVPDTVADAFVWVRNGTFAPVPGVVPVGGLVFCSRYGLETRDFLFANDLSSRESFRLFNLLRVERDDAEVWPETAVARLSCQITWDDTRAVTILPEAAVAPVLAGSFAELLDTMPAGQGAFYGENGYHLTAMGGASDTVILLDRVVLVLTMRHQSLRIRSFLLNGGA